MEHASDDGLNLQIRNLPLHTAHRRLMNQSNYRLMTYPATGF